MMEKLWTLKDVANYLGVAYAVACTYSKGGSFPKAIRLPNGKGGYSHPKWVSSEVVDWVKSYQ